ncbi:MAG: hypothetical protein RMI01_09690, partial [Thermodesulfovibrio sp.]|nr:hypothetical protein [Thermodesulfovibrio sp.]
VDIQYKYAGDYEFILRAYNHKFKFKKVNKFVTNFRISGVSTKAWKEARLEVLKIKRKYSVGFLNVVFSYFKFIIKFILLKVGLGHESLLYRIFNKLKNRFRLWNLS